jgi:glutamyl-tRNA synthetase
VKAGAGRYAPSPSSDLHLGNLRTAVLAYLVARGQGLDFRMRLEDLDERCRPEFARRQLATLRELGIRWDGPVLRQSERRRVYDAAIKRLADQGLVYECFCSRRDILQAARAPHRPPGAYPGTCRRLSAAAADRRRLVKEPAIRLRAQVAAFPVKDRLAGESLQPVDDFILRRADGLAAYNLAVVVDDAAQGVTEVTRGDDLLSSSGRQSYLAELLGLPGVSYSHVPLVYAASGRRLSKRDADLAGAALFRRHGGALGVLELIAGSIGLGLGDSAAAVTGGVQGRRVAPVPQPPAGAGGEQAGSGGEQAGSGGDRMRAGADGIVPTGGYETDAVMDELVDRFDWERLTIGAWEV